MAEKQFKGDGIVWCVPPSGLYVSESTLGKYECEILSKGGRFC